MIDLLHELLDHQEAPCVTVCMPVTSDIHSTLDHIETTLQGYGLSARARKQFLASARTFAERDLPALTDARSFVLYISPTTFHAITLQDEHEQSVTIGRHFHLLPFLSPLLKSMHYYILVVSKKHVRLFEADHDSISPKDIDGLPSSIDDAWKGMERQEKSLQFHSTGSGTAGFHGQGGAKDTREQEEDRFMHMIAKSLHTFLHGQHDPLVFAGVEEAFGMFRTFDTSGKLLDEYIRGNPDDFSMEDLKAKADPIVHAWSMKRNEALLEEYGALQGTGRTSTDIGMILGAAHNGKVDLLILAEGVQMWGGFNTENGKATVHTSQNDGDEELCGVASAHTLKHHGRVIMMHPDKMPEGAKIAAVLRY